MRIESPMAPTVPPPQIEAAAESRARRASAGWPGFRGRGWVWPHLISLDAPAVALTWQDWWGRAVHASPTPGQRLVLGLGVWLLYLADRLADNARGNPQDRQTARHAFARKWQRPLLVLAAVIAMSLAALAPAVLSAGQFRAGLAFLALAVAYFGLIHRRGPQRWAAIVPKEAVVGVMFAAGTAFFAFCSGARPSGEAVAAVAMFGLACFLNCALITSWERNRCDRRDPCSLLNAFPRLAGGGVGALSWLLAFVAGTACVAFHTRDALPVALAAFLLGVLDRWRHRFSPDVLRTLADVVLLTPWICLALSFERVG